MLVLRYEHEPNPKKTKSGKLHVVWVRYKSNKTPSENFCPCLVYSKACLFQNKDKSEIKHVCENLENFQNGIY